MALLIGGPASASFYFAVNVRAVLAASNKTEADLAHVAKIDLDSLSRILNTRTNENARLSLNTAANTILPALRELTGLSDYVTFESFCCKDLVEDTPIMFDHFIREARSRRDRFLT